MIRRTTGTLSPNKLLADQLVYAAKMVDPEAYELETLLDDETLEIVGGMLINSGIVLVDVVQDGRRRQFAKFER